MSSRAWQLAIFIAHNRVCIFYFTLQEWEEHLHSFFFFFFFCHLLSSETSGLYLLIIILPHLALMEDQVIGRCQQWVSLHFSLPTKPIPSATLYQVVHGNLPFSLLTIVCVFSFYFAGMGKTFLFCFLPFLFHLLSSETSGPYPLLIIISTPLFS